MKRCSALIAAGMLLAASWSAPAAEPATAQQAVHVLNRLAFGPRPGDIERVRAMGIDRYIDMQLEPSAIPLPPALAQRLAALPVESQTAGETLAQFLGDPPFGGDEQAMQRRRQASRRIVEQTAQARFLRAVESPRQLEEVMVDFWFNHFNVFIGKGLDAALVASYERDAIRPYALGSFRDLLGATARHPAMLFYLDNWLSTAAGYHSAGRFAAGPKARAAGLNENYARELMELHTLGADAGYTQRDVTELARIFTGWSFAPQQLARGNRAFQFDAERHDQGDKDWLGQRIAAGGQQEGERALDILAMHPATARRIAWQLAQYFVQDDPPAALVGRLAQRYLDTRGDIRSVLRTLFHSPEFRSPAAVGAKFKTPYRFVVSATRAAGVPTDNLFPQLGMLMRLGMPLYGCQTPDGYKNTEAAWLNPEALQRRIGFAAAMAAGRLPAGPPPAQADRTMAPAQNGAASADAAQIAYDPPDAAQLLNTLGAGISEQTRRAIDGRPPALQAAMILGGPDFMRH